MTVHPEVRPLDRGLLRNDGQLPSASKRHACQALLACSLCNKARLMQFGWTGHHAVIALPSLAICIAVMLLRGCSDPVWGKPTQGHLENKILVFHSSPQKLLVQAVQNCDRCCPHDRQPNSSSSPCLASRQALQTG